MSVKFLIFVFLANLLLVSSHIQVSPTFGCLNSNDEFPSVNINLGISFVSSGRDSNVIKSDQCGLNLPRPYQLPPGQSYEGEFPWHVSIYKSTFKSINYECVGNLISRKMVLTSSVCITVGAPVDIERIIMFVGAYNFLRHNGHYQQRSVRKIIMHQDFEYSYFENDLALLEMNEPVTYNDYVRPICLYKGPPVTDKIVGTEGLVAGWSYNSLYYTEEELSSITMIVKPKAECYLRRTGITSIATSKTQFCVGYDKKIQTCKGDDGAGWFVQEGGVWYVRGVTSCSIGYQNEVVCDRNHYAAMTDVSLFIPWIQQYL